MAAPNQGLEGLRPHVQRLPAPAVGGCLHPISTCGKEGRNVARCSPNIQTVHQLLNTIVYYKFCQHKHLCTTMYNGCSMNRWGMLMILHSSWTAQLLFWLYN